MNLAVDVKFFIDSKKKGDFEKEIPEIYRKFFLEISVCVAGPASHTL